jgi:hypothetical protein
MRAIETGKGISAAGFFILSRCHQSDSDDAITLEVAALLFLPTSCPDGIYSYLRSPESWGTHIRLVAHEIVPCWRGMQINQLAMLRRTSALIYSA